MLVGHLFIYMVRILFLSEFYIYWSVPFQIHVRNCYGISNVLLFVLGKAKVLLSWLDSFSYPSRPSQVLLSWTLFSVRVNAFPKDFFNHDQYIDTDSSNYSRPLDLYKIWRSKFFFFFGLTWNFFTLSANLVAFFSFF